MFKVVWEMKDGRKILDEHSFESEKEASTYAGIELTQIEAEGIKDFEVIEAEGEE